MEKLIDADTLFYFEYANVKYQGFLGRHWLANFGGYWEHRPQLTLSKEVKKTIHLFWMKWNVVFFMHLADYHVREEEILEVIIYKDTERFYDSTKLQKLVELVLCESWRKIETPNELMYEALKRKLLTFQ